MFKLNLSKIKLLVAFAIGYVAGAAAGRQRYQSIKAGAQKVAENPTVQAAAKKAGDTLADKAPVVLFLIASATTGALSARVSPAFLAAACTVGFSATFWAPALMLW